MYEKDELYLVWVLFVTHLIPDVFNKQFQMLSLVGSLKFTVFGVCCM